LQPDTDAEEGLAGGDVVVDGWKVAGIGKGFETVAEMTDAREYYFLGRHVSRSRMRKGVGRKWKNCRKGQR